MSNHIRISRSLDVIVSSSHRSLPLLLRLALTFRGSATGFVATTTVPSGHAFPVNTFAALTRRVLTAR